MLRCRRRYDKGRGQAFARLCRRRHRFSPPFAHTADGAYASCGRTSVTICFARRTLFARRLLGASGLGDFITMKLKLNAAVSLTLGTASAFTDAKLTFVMNKAASGTALPALDGTNVS